MDLSIIHDQVGRVLAATKEVHVETKQLDQLLKNLGSIDVGTTDPFIMCLTIFFLACFVGYYVVWKVTPALHSPLMSVTNAISSVIIVGALIGVGSTAVGISSFLGFMAVTLASVNIFGGFIITQRMLSMFSKNK